MKTEKLNKTWEYYLIVNFQLTKDFKRKQIIQILKWKDIVFHKIILWDKVTKQVWTIPHSALDIYDLYNAYLPTDFANKI